MTLTKRIAVLASVSVVVAGCSSVSVDGNWAEGADRADRKKTFDRIVVLGVSPNSNARCDFELFMRTQLRDDATEAQASCNLMKLSEDITRESVEEAVREYDADAVIATVLVASKLGTQEGGEAETRGGLDFKATDAGYVDPYFYDPFYGPWYGGGYGAYGIPVIYGEFKEAPVLTSLDGEVTIQTMVFDTSDASMVYEIRTTAKDLRSRDDALAHITPPIAEELRGAGIIR